MPTSYGINSSAANDGGLVELYRTEDNRVASNSGEEITDPPTTYLSSAGVRVDSLVFSCQQAAEQTGAIIDVRLTVSTGNPDTLSPESYHSEAFATQVYVRSYQ
ncbi:hypothetical protein LRY65_00130 [Candidatus Woesebacteria bacterium]|nr:hypothetical protein [Candidatus Woesebacteria bacterium]